MTINKNVPKPRPKRKPKSEKAKESTYRSSQNVEKQEERLQRKQRNLKKRKEALSKAEQTQQGQGTVWEDSEIDSLPPSTREYMEEEAEVIFEPNPGPQTDFLAASEREVLYGGPLVPETRVVTPTGYRQLGDLEVGDKVASPSGTFVDVVDIPFDGVEECYTITFNDGTEVIASAGHKWYVGTSDWRKTNTPFRVKRTIDLLDYKMSRGRNKYFVPLTAPLNWRQQEHYISPYILGVLLGDGIISDPTKASFVSLDEEIAARVTEECPASYRARPPIRGITYQICREGYGNTTRNGVAKEIERLGLSGTYSYNKFIPDEYLYDSVENRLALLQGLMDTDGTLRIPEKRRGAECKYTTVSPHLKDGFVFLAQSLGYKVSTYVETLNSGQDAYRIILCGGVSPFYISRKVERFNQATRRYPVKYITDIKKAGNRRVRCITTNDANNLFLIEGFTTTHNSAGGGKTMALMVDPLRYCHFPEFRAIIFRRTNDELREIVQKSKELYSRAFPGAKWSKQDSTWTFPSGAQIWLTYLDRDDDVTRYQGQAFHHISFDELTTYPTPYPWNYMRSRLRTTNRDIPLCMRASCNPGGVGGWWVKQMFVDPAPWGQAFPAFDLETGQKLTYPKGHSKEGEPLFHRRFIPARLHDNPYLFEDGQYEANLLSLPESQRRQLLEGDWDVVEGAAFPEFRRGVHTCEPFEIPEGWTRFRAADYGYSAPGAVLWFAVDFDGNLYVYRELYQKGLNAEDFADKVLEMEQNENIKYGMLDSSVWHRRGDVGPPIAETMIRQGCRWTPADRSPGSRIAGKLELHRRLKEYPTGQLDDEGNPVSKPSLVIFSTCTNLIRTFPLLPLDKNKPEDVDTDSEDHLYDALRYGVMSRPSKPKESFGSQLRVAQSRNNFEPSDAVFGY